MNHGLLKDRMQTRGAARIVKRPPTVSDAELVIRETHGLAIGCAHPDCEGVSIEVSASAVCSVKSPHRKDVHATAFTVGLLVQTFLSVTKDRGAVTDLRRMMDEWLNAA